MKAQDKLDGCLLFSLHPVIVRRTIGVVYFEEKTALKIIMPDKEIDMLLACWKRHCLCGVYIFWQMLIMSGDFYDKGFENLHRPANSARALMHGSTSNLLAFIR